MEAGDALKLMLTQLSSRTQGVLFVFALMGIALLSLELSPDLLRVIGFTFTQALLSAFLSWFLGCVLGVSIITGCVGWFSKLAKLAVLPFYLPSLVIVLILISAYGRQGLVNQWLSGLVFLDLFYRPSALLLAHVFFNFGFVANLVIEKSKRVPADQLQLGRMLGFSFRNRFKLFDWPLCKEAFQDSFLLILVMCLTSFSIPLLIGGGPQSATTEVYIYEAIRYESDFGEAAGAILMQVILLAFLNYLTLKATRSKYSSQQTEELREPKFNTIKRQDLSAPFESSLVTILAVILLGFGLLPQLSMVLTLMPNVAGMLGVFADEEVAIAILHSLVVACLASFSILLFGFWLLSSCENPMLQSLSNVVTGKKRVNTYFVGLDLVRIVLLAFSPVALAYLMEWLLAPILQSFVSEGVFRDSIRGLLLTVVHVILFLPFFLTLMLQHYQRFVEDYHDIRIYLAGNRLQKMFFDFKALRGVSLMAWFICFSFSISEGGASLFLSTRGFKTLPVILYESIGAYKMDQAATLGVLLGVFSLISWKLASRLSRKGI